MTSFDLETRVDILKSKVCANIWVLYINGNGRMKQQNKPVGLVYHDNEDVN